MFDISGESPLFSNGINLRKQKVKSLLRTRLRQEPKRASVAERYANFFLALQYLRFFTVFGITKTV